MVTSEVTASASGEYSHGELTFGGIQQGVPVTACGQNRPPEAHNLSNVGPDGPTRSDKAAVA
ncbi:hypothetical protein Pen02_07850 [Plantactinospora endophytica]|uniref:Uncharacterized protein n=1 Tax=Plantactinospora endophytica TaxID=673535 RepID=A0ABQ4DTV4_9ACTN|nr:hypothetical protein Pen02_07850 [Plantactinospora endophytica]